MVLLPKTLYRLCWIAFAISLSAISLSAHQVALKNGQVIEFEQYRVTEEALHYTDSAGKEVRVALNNIDFDRTRELSASDKTPLDLPGLNLADLPQNKTASALEMVQAPSLADVARQLNELKEQKARQEKSVSVYEGILTLRATPKVADAENKLITQMQIFVGNSSRRDYRYVFTVNCSEWSKKISANIKGSAKGNLIVDVSPPCKWSTVSLADLREAEGLNGPEPEPSKVPGIDDGELARQAKMQKVVENAPSNSISELQRRVDEACKRQSLQVLTTEPVEGIGDHLTACGKANDDLTAALRIQGETQIKTRTEALNQALPSGSVEVRLTGATGLPFTGTCSISNRGGTISKSFDDILPFQVPIENADTVNCSFVSKSDFRNDMKLEILKDNQVIGESNTDEPFGLVSVSRNLN